MLTIKSSICPKKGNALKQDVRKKFAYLSFKKNIIPESGKFFPLFLFFVFFFGNFSAFIYILDSNRQNACFLFAFLHLLCYNKRAI